MGTVAWNELRFSKTFCNTSNSAIWLAPKSKKTTRLFRYYQNIWLNRLAGTQKPFLFSNKEVCFTKKAFLKTFFGNQIPSNLCKKLEAAVLKSLAIFKEKSSVGARSAATLLKGDSNTGVFLWILQNF